MRTILKFQNSEKFYLEDLTEVEPTEQDLVIEVTEDNSEVYAEEFTLTVTHEDKEIHLEIYPRKCEFSNKGFADGYLIGGARIAEGFQDEYCKTIGYESWDKFINTQTLENPITKKQDLVYISDSDREQLAEDEAEVFVYNGVEYNISDIEDIEDATTDDSYWSEWEIDTDEPFYLANGINVSTNEE